MITVPQVYNSVMEKSKKSVYEPRSGKTHDACTWDVLWTLDVPCTLIDISSMIKERPMTFMSIISMLSMMSPYSWVMTVVQAPAQYLLPPLGL